MARRWTPRRFVVLRRIRVVSCALLVVLAMVLTFFISARKSVALSVNGQTKMVTTYAYSVDGLLREQGIKVKTHDLVDSTS
ncbi:MAG: ubiquitin-like domain-containing protein, partial [Bifidobacterium sp.]|nr:ubiquitin-like domain-containing protein [Bifidobacterium sp.]